MNGGFMADKSMAKVYPWVAFLAAVATLLAAVSAAAHGAYGSYQHKKREISLELSVLGTYQAIGRPFDEGAAEIVAHDPWKQRLFVINGATNEVDVLDCHDPSNLVRLFAISLSGFGSGPTSVDVHGGIVAVSVVADVKTDPGKVVFFDLDGNYLNDVTVGALPDMVTFTPDGRHLLVANEGEPNDEYTVDPPGSVSIIPIGGWFRHYGFWHFGPWYFGVKHLQQEDVRTVDFAKFNGTSLDPSIRIYGPNATVAQDLEPEYIAISEDSRTAWITLQENNALAILDIRKAKIEKLVGLGFKDHNQPGQGLDPSDRDNGANIAPWPVFGMYEPDGIAHFRVHGRSYLITANEGDTRDYDGFAEEARVGTGSGGLQLEPTKLSAATLKTDAALGRLTVTIANGDTDDDGDFDELYVPGARSFSIWNHHGKLVYDSGDQLEQITNAALPAYFNSNNDDNDSFDTRSDNKGPEPEGVVVAELWHQTFAFVGLERIGGIAVFDITDPEEPEFVTYVNNRNFSQDAESEDGGDLGPEGLLFIPWWQSPIHQPLLVVGNEVSGTTTVYRIKELIQ
jgi:hypothetical protein